MTLHVGDQLLVTLEPDWTPPRAQATAADPGPALHPLRTDGATGFPNGPATATFTAARVGDATVTARTDAACLHTVPQCMVAQLAFEVTVHVQPRPGTGAGPLPMTPPT